MSISSLSVITTLQTNNFITLYKGRMYKCPPMGVLEHSLTTFGIADKVDWQPYIKDYQTVSPASTEQEIEAWFKRTLGPEKVCNMCGFMYSRGQSGIPAQQHLPKKLFKLKPTQ